MEPVGQNVEQEAPDELIWDERHRAKSRSAVAAVILVAEGYAAWVEADQPAKPRPSRRLRQFRRLLPGAGSRAAARRRDPRPAAAQHRHDGRARGVDRGGRGGLAFGGRAFASRSVRLFSGASMPYFCRTWSYH